MKTVFALLLTLAIAASAAEQQTQDGKTWRQWDRREHVFWVSGYITAWDVALAAVALDDQLGIGEHLTPEKHPKLEAIGKLAHEVPAKLTVGDIVDGLDRFYEEPANRNILISNGIRVLASRVNGASDEKVNTFILMLREQSSH